ncbi:hypothetical protein PH5382_02166 [Phaeobacter sp. CECT 5382]|nr:hypothetical protein PH5382_02166 [Phaeobacter sp. CECT 5382]
MSWKNSKPISEASGPSRAASGALGSACVRSILNWGCGLSLAFLIQSAPLAALSCAPWNGAQAYLAAAQSDRTYSVVVGRLQFDEGLLPLTEGGDPNELQPSTSIPGTLSGKILEARHFSRRISTDVTLVVDCVAGWCGKVQSGARYLMFVEQGTAGPVLRVTPCGDFIFPDGSAVRRQVLDCHRGVNCQPE